MRNGPNQQLLHNFLGKSELSLRGDIEKIAEARRSTHCCTLNACERTQRRKRTRRDGTLEVPKNWGLRRVCCCASGNESP